MEAKVVYTESELSGLRKKLYMAARASLEPQFQGDGDAVRARRDGVCDTMFNKPYTELSKEQLVLCIAELEREARDFATQEQIRLIKFLGLSLAIRRADLSRFSDEPEVFRKELTAIFHDHRRRMSANVVRHLYESYINPLCNRYLAEGGFKHCIKNSALLYYNRMSKPEATYVCVRLQQFYDVEINKTQC